MMIRAVFIDLSGTLHVEHTAVPGAQAALKKLREANLKLKFVTNTTKESKADLVNQLQRLGFDIQPDELYTSLSAARTLIESRNLRPMYMLTESALVDFKGIPTEDPNAVVVGLAPEQFNYERMSQAMNLLLKEGSALIAIHKARYFKSKDGLRIGPGAIVSGLEYSTGVKCEVVGKPNANFFKGALRALGVDGAEAVMVGDDVLDDVGGALEAGLGAGLLVRTGKYREGDENRDSVRPTETVASFPEAVEWILQRMASNQ